MDSWRGRSKKAQAGASPGPLRAGSLAGQAIPLDFVAGLFIFLVVLAYFIILWDIYSVQYVAALDKTDADVQVLTVSDMLVSTGGVPDNWSVSPASVQSIGLARKPNELDPYRVDAFSRLSYADAKWALGIDRDFIVKIETPDGGRLATIGQSPGNTTRASEITRVAILNNTVVHVKVQLYE